MINPAIFRNYDIRGSSLTDITPENAYKIAFCFGKMNSLKENNQVYVARDGRLSSPRIYEGLVSGLIDSGMRVISIGLAPTPLLYFVDKKFRPAASIMITGSHNPKDDNGFKLLAMGQSFYGDQIKELHQLIRKSSWQDINVRRIDLEEIDFTAEYINEIVEGFVINSRLKVAWDCGNGAAGAITEILSARLPNCNIVINGKIDGNFPADHPDPTVPENLEQLINVVTQNNCDFGLAFDGDADRIGVVTGKGRIIYGDQLLCLFAKDILGRNPSATIIADVKSSQILFDQIELHGGKPLMWKTGHSFIKAKMAETNALLAGEMSGHIFFADKYYGYDDAIYAAIRLLELASRSAQSLDEMIDQLPQAFSTPEIRIAASEDQKFQIIEQIKQELHSNGIVFSDIDGIRVNAETGWWLLRASNTEAAIIARCESSSSTGLDKLKQQVKTLLSQYSILPK